MVIGNGFFSDTESDALKEMKNRSGCEVKRCVFPTIGNILYFISTKGDIYGMQTIQGKRLTRTRTVQKNKGGITARLSSAPHKESWYPLQVLTYCTFTLNEWKPDVQLEFKNGNPYDVRPDNLQPKEKYIPPEWKDAMTNRQEAYRKEYSRVCYSTAFFVDVSLEDAKDIVSQTFIELCTTGNNPSIKTTEDFIGLWFKLSKMRAIDFYHHYGKRFNADCYDVMLEIRGKRDKPYELDLFHLQPGEKRSTYLRMWTEGNTPTEIAKVCGCSLGTVSSSLTRSIQFLQRYFKREKEL